MTAAISATSNATASTPSTSSTTQASTVDYNAFLQLLVQELKNQDPTSPSDPAQYLSQLASFSSVEQGVNTNSRLDTLLKTSALTQAETMIGLKATSSDGSTSGRVTAVQLGSTGVAVATLDTGKTLTLDNSVTIALPTAAASTATGSTGQGS